uniref:Uncharacterized protein n=1 Tax=Glossina palpalis gambiensis TaxID=67801 RepID=A0A1B0BLB3_9MUSC
MRGQGEAPLAMKGTEGYQLLLFVNTTSYTMLNHVAELKIMCFKDREEFSTNRCCFQHEFSTRRDVQELEAEWRQNYTTASSPKSDNFAESHHKTFSILVQQRSQTILSHFRSLFLQLNELLSKPFRTNNRFSLYSSLKDISDCNWIFLHVTLTSKRHGELNKFSFSHTKCSKCEFNINCNHLLVIIVDNN